MPLYSYTKVAKSRKHRVKKNAPLLSAFFISIGLGIIGWVIYPILNFELFYAPKFAGLIQPIPGEIIKDTLSQKLPQVLGADNTDYTRASVWFPKAERVLTVTDNSSYYLSVPKVGVDQATVFTGSDDLSKSLIQFTGPLPGNNGNTVIFGHSTLLWFYNPKDYKSIFSKLPELTVGDEIMTYVDNIAYRYKVVDMRVVAPTDFSVLDQNMDGQNLTLITCVPPGTYLKRLAVHAKLDNI